MKTAWKVINKGMKSNSGCVTWKKGVWKTHKGKLELCEKGFHASNLLVDAIQYVTPGIVCLVEYEGKSIEGDDKFVCSRMRVIKTFRLTKKMSVEFAIFCASSCLKFFEKDFPSDKRPRLAVRAAKKWLIEPTRKNANAAGAAGAAGDAAWAAAGDAARAEIKQKLERKLHKIIKHTKKVRT